MFRPASTPRRGAGGQADLTREREVLTEEAKASGKPDNIVEKMVDGRMRKFYEEFVLLEQECMLA